MAREERIRQPKIQGAKLIMGKSKNELFVRTDTTDWWGCRRAAASLLAEVAESGAQPIETKIALAQSVTFLGILDVLGDIEAQLSDRNLESPLMAAINGIAEAIGELK